MQWHNIMSKKIQEMIRMDKDTTVDDMSTGTTIDAKDMEEEVDSLGIETTDHVTPSSASHVIKRDIDMQTVHIRIELISNSILIMGQGITH